MKWQTGGLNPDLRRFLSRDEWRHVSLTSRLHEDGGESSVSDGTLWTGTDGSAVCGALYFSCHGMLLPVFDDLDTAGQKSVKKLIKPLRRRLFSIIGMEERVRSAEALLGHPAPDAENYRMLTCSQPPPDPGTPIQFEICRADVSDLDRLWPLEKEYQTEEVLRPGKKLNEQSFRRHFLNTLTHQEIYYATVSGRPVAKAGTNARGWRCDQAGGVYVVPDMRGKGLARALMTHLIHSGFSKGRSVCLFVKQSNIPAIRLYHSLGFADRGAFRISYWS